MRQGCHYVMQIDSTYRPVGCWYLPVDGVESSIVVIVAVFCYMWFSVLCSWKSVCVCYVVLVQRRPMLYVGGKEEEKEEERGLGSGVGFRCEKGEGGGKVLPRQGQQRPGFHQKKHPPSQQ